MNSPRGLHRELTFAIGSALSTSFAQGHMTMRKLRVFLFSLFLSSLCQLCSITGVEVKLLGPYTSFQIWVFFVISALVVLMMHDTYAPRDYLF